MAKRIDDTWKQEDVEEALLRHRNGEVGFNETCGIYDIPEPTLRRHLKSLNKAQKFERPNDLKTEMEE